MFYLIVGAFFSLMFAVMLGTVAVMEWETMKRDIIGSTLAVVAGGMFSILPLLIAAQTYILTRGAA